MSDDHGDTPPPLIHVGYHRTGTTFLQREVFAGIGPRLGSARKAFVSPDDHDFDPRRAADELAGRRVISNERLSGYPHSGGHDASQIAHRIARTFPDARILIVVREQDDMALSCYRLYVKVGGPLSLARYLNPPGRDRVPQFDLRYLEYHRLVGLYLSLFKDVLVLPYEQLADDPRAFLGAIADFGGFEAPRGVPIRHNKGLSVAGLALKRRANAIFVRHSTNPRGLTTSEAFNDRLIALADRVDRLIPMREDRLRRTVRAVLADRFLESNHLLARATGVDLERYGYRM